MNAENQLPDIRIKTDNQDYKSMYYKLFWICHFLLFHSICRFLDAPVSGGVTGAEAATLAFMVGGEEKDLDQVKSIMLQMGAKVFRCGTHGAGQIAKLCNNLIFGKICFG